MWSCEHMENFHVPATTTTSTACRINGTCMYYSMWVWQIDDASDDDQGPSLGKCLYFNHRRSVIAKLSRPPCRQCITVHGFYSPRCVRQRKPFCPGQAYLQPAVLVVVVNQRHSSRKCYCLDTRSQDFLAAVVVTYRAYCIRCVAASHLTRLELCAWPYTGEISYLACHSLNSSGMAGRTRWVITFAPIELFEIIAGEFEF